MFILFPLTDSIKVKFTIKERCTNIKSISSNFSEIAFKTNKSILFIRIKRAASIELEKNLLILKREIQHNTAELKSIFSFLSINTQSIIYVAD